MTEQEPHYLKRLNDRQREAVLAIDGPVSVLAGAGAGKTSVLTTRIYHLIRQGIEPESILAVTFTNKAAREMRERVLRMLGREPNERAAFRGATGVPFIATFHGLGRELLEQYGRAINVPRYFSIYDRDDGKRTIRQALKALDVDPKEVPPSVILARISKEKGEGVTAAKFKEQVGRESFRALITAEAWLRYETTLAKEKALDFDDLIALPVRLLSEHEDVQRQVRERFSHIHIDEYQDTNALQGRLAELITNDARNLFVVGDIDQCVYAWRGATIDNLLRFDETYPNARHIVLEHNYRSTKTIVAAANEIIEKNVNRKEKRSVTDNATGELITIQALDTAEREAAWVASEAARALANDMPAREVAVLYRTNAQSRALEEAFLHARLPYRLLGTRFFDRKEVKDVLAWIRLALDPSREADYVRAVQAPSRGIGKVTLGKIATGRKGELRPSDQAKVEIFEAVITELTQATLKKLPSELVKLVLERSGMRTSLEKEGEDGQERLENVRELGALASRYDWTPGTEGVAAFLADAALASDQDELDRPRGKNQDAITLMTVHAAKGLEFNLVFVTGMEEGLFPHEGRDDEDRDEEEERRLFYVAVTRAKKRLVLTLARARRIYGTEYLTEPSSFLRDIDPSRVALSYEEYEDTIQI